MVLRHSSDQAFGSRDFSEWKVLGRNSLFVWHVDYLDEKRFESALRKIQQALLLESPTRVLIIGPTHLLQDFIKARTACQLAYAPRDFPFLSTEGQVLPSKDSISVVLGINKESMWLDPIDWPVLKSKLREWSTCNCPLLTLSEIADSRFNERTVPPHGPRSPLGQDNNPLLTFYQFATKNSHHQERRNELLAQGVSPKLTHLVYKINKFNPLLSSLGILPNQLRTILKGTNIDSELATRDLSDTLFRRGYEIWKARQKLNRNFWKKIARTEWKPKEKHKKTKKESKKQHIVCHNPFHFLQLHSNLSKQRPTPCSCTQFSPKMEKNKTDDIRRYFPNAINTPEISHTSSNMNSFATREGLIRGEHDRSKRKQSDNRLFL